MYQFFSLLIYFGFTTAGVKCRVATVKCLSVLHHSVDYICSFFGTSGPVSVVGKQISAQFGTRG